MAGQSRGKPATDSDASRPPIPIEAGHPVTGVKCSRPKSWPGRKIGSGCGPSQAWSLHRRTALPQRWTMQGPPLPRRGANGSRFKIATDSRFSFAPPLLSRAGLQPTYERPRQAFANQDRANVTASRSQRAAKPAMIARWCPLSSRPARTRHPFKIEAAAGNELA
jgi:hypothetical protein